MGQSFYESSQRAFAALHARIEAMDNQVVSLSHVLKEIVGKELMRGQALHKVLMDKGLFTDEELKKGLEDIIAEAKADLEKEAAKIQAEKQKAVEILIPADVKITKDGAVAPTIITPTEETK